MGNYSWLAIVGVVAIAILVIYGIMRLLGSNSIPGRMRYNQNMTTAGGTTPIARDETILATPAALFMAIFALIGIIWVCKYALCYAYDWGVESGKVEAGKASSTTTASSTTPTVPATIKLDSGGLEKKMDELGEKLSKNSTPSPSPTPSPTPSPAPAKPEAQKASSGNNGIVHDPSESAKVVTDDD